MQVETPGTSRRGVSPLLILLAAFPIACFTCALLTDIAYVRTVNVMWADFSAWLLAAGLAGGVVAGVIGLVVRAVGHDRFRRPVWPLALGSLLTLAAALVNNLVHSRDAWTSVVPTGLALSAVTVLLLLVTALLSPAIGRRLSATSYSGVTR